MTLRSYAIDVVLVLLLAWPASAQDWQAVASRLERSIYQVDSSLSVQKCMSAAGHTAPPVICKEQVSGFRLQAVNEGRLCSAWVVSHDIAVTNAHCVIQDAVTKVGGRTAVVMKIDRELDAAVLRVPEGLSGAPLSLSRADVRPGDVVAASGFPFGEPVPFFFLGIVAQPSRGGLYIQIAFFGGASGSPVVNADAAVVSMLNVSRGDRARRFLSRGLETDALYDFVKEFL
jgi:S1-C subfamily serine protease